MGANVPIKDTMLTKCKLCPESVFRHQTWTWMCDGMIGIVHAECYETVYGRVPDRTTKITGTSLLPRKKRQTRQKNGRRRNAKVVNLQGSSSVEVRDAA
jgi:hypothetical protein